MFIRAVSILPADLDVLREQAEDSEQARQCATRPDLVEELVAVHVFFIPYAAAARVGRLTRLRIHLYVAIDHAIEAVVLVK